MCLRKASWSPTISPSCPKPPAGRFSFPRRNCRPSSCDGSGELFRYPARGWISSPYGWRTDPISGERRFHNGIDIAGPHGSAVIAALDGRVIETGYNDTAGNYVILSHLGGYTTFYAHLSVIHVRQGQWVQERQRIGNVGNSGYSTGSHLHFTVSRWGKPVNPSLLLH